MKEDGDTRGRLLLFVQGLRNLRRRRSPRRFRTIRAVGIPQQSRADHREFGYGSGSFL